MTERKCSHCGELFLPGGRNQRKCPDCQGERHSRDCVTQMSSNQSYRLDAGLRMLHHVGE